MSEQPAPDQSAAGASTPAGSGSGASGRGSSIASLVRWLTLPADVRRDLIDVLWLFVTLRIALGVLAFFLWYTNSLPWPCHFEFALDGWKVFPPIDNQGIAFPLVGVWQRWDACWYTNIATNGYVIDNSVSFWPLFPALTGFAGGLLNGDVALGGLVVNAFAYVLAMLGLLRLVRLDFGSSIARRTVLLISIFPAAFFFFAPFTEAIFLACSVWAIYGARRHEWSVAAVAALLAGFSRTQGIFLILPVGWEAVSYWWSAGHMVGIGARAGPEPEPLESVVEPEPRVSRPRWAHRGQTVSFGPLQFDRFVADLQAWRPPDLESLLAPAVAAVLPVVAFAAFVVFARQTTGQSPLESQNLWGGADFHAPWDTIQTAWNWAQAHNDPVELLNVIVLVFFLAATVVGLFRLPLAYSLFAVPQVLVVAVRIQPTPLTSTTRLMLVVFPVFVLLALLGRNRRFERAWLLLSVVLLAYLVSLFVQGNFVA